MNELNAKMLHKKFHYSNGKLFHKTSPAANVKIGDVVGCDNGDGYWVTTIDSKRYKIHQLIFMMFFGYIPKCIDHINRDPSDNRFANLRAVEPSYNQVNTTKRINFDGKKTSSEFKGVCWNKKNSNWMSKISKHGKQIYLGSFKHEIDAARAYNEKAIELYGNHIIINNIEEEL